MDEPSEAVNPEQLLADFAATGDVTDPHARTRARLFLADVLTLARAAGDVPGFETTHALGVGTGPHRDWFTGEAVGLNDAAYVNAHAAHARFQDDTDMSTWSHPGSFVIPVAVAATIEAGGTLGTIIDAAVVGYASTRWLGAEGVLAPLLKARGFRPSPTFAPLGAAMAGVRALGIDAEAARHAVDAAALLSRGTLHSVGGGGDDWRLHNASGARDGMSVALAAARGMRSAPEGLTGENGFLWQVAGTDVVPERWRTGPVAQDIADVWHKALPVLGDNMSVALAARHAHGVVAGRGIEGVTVVMNGGFARFPGTQRRPPYEGPTAAQASVRFCVAHLLLHGALTYGDLVHARSREVDELADALVVVADDGMDFLDGRVEVTTADGSSVVSADELPRTLFFRDRDEQLRSSEELLGAAGRDLAAYVMDTDETTPADLFLTEALDLARR